MARRYEKRLRNRNRVAIDGDIVSMSDADLKNLHYEVARAQNEARDKLAEINRRLDAIRAERMAREVRTSSGIAISEHAVVRYLERHKGMDIAAIREEIAALAMAATSARPGKYGLRHGDGISFGVDEEGKTVTTVLNGVEANIIEGGL